MSYNPYYSQEGGIQERLANHQYQSSKQFLFQPQNSQHETNQESHTQPQFTAFQDPRASMAFQFGQTAFNQFIGQENLSQLQETMHRATGNANLSHYFQVSNSYVFQKLKVILFPFINKQWQRIPDSNNSFQPPRNDINSPDMYIPVMGLVTYILAWNLDKGLNGSFDPENLYFKLSSTLAVFVLDLLILKFGLYLLVSTNSATTSLIELACYVGYKFVPLIVAMMLPTNLSKFMIIPLKVYIFIAFGVFLLRSIKFNSLVDSTNDLNTIKKSAVRRCNYFLFVYGFLWQTALMWLIG